MISREGTVECLLSVVSIVLFHYVTKDPNPVDVAKATVSKPDSQGFRLLRMKESKVLGTSLKFVANVRWIFFLPALLDVYFIFRDEFYRNTLSPSESAEYRRIQRFRYLAYAGLFIGGLLRVWTFHALGKSFMFHLGVRKDQKLVTTGIYSFVRHPSYLGAAFLVIGGALFPFTGRFGIRILGTLSWPTMKILAFPIFMEPLLLLGVTQRVKNEEKMLLDAFGKEWIDYTKAVPWKILPLIY